MARTTVTAVPLFVSQKGLECSYNFSSFPPTPPHSSSSQEG